MMRAILLPTATAVLLLTWVCPRRWAQVLKLAIDHVDARLDLADLVAGIGGDRSERVGQSGVSVLDLNPHGGDHFP
jgi:hypothetical protein